nr:MAG TPA: hypothetical protein [Caudoviricetes sp.]
MIENQKPVVPGALGDALTKALKQQAERRPVEQTKPPQEKK